MPRKARVDPAAKPEETFSSGSLVDHFRVIRILGQGGMGEVYLARDTKLGRKVALKVIHPKRLGSKSAVERFLQEARATATFNHPHIVTIHTTGEHQGKPYVALEYLEGETLRRRMEESPPSLKETLRIGLAIARALKEAHEHRVLHRDLKPENVVLPRDGRLRVVDFGLAKLVSSQDPLAETVIPEPEQASDSDGDGDGDGDSDGDGDGDTTGQPPAQAETLNLPSTRAPVSLTRGIRGTPEYMAPEQWTDGPVTQAADVWALGVILYELASGERPFGDASFFGLAYKVPSPEPVPPLRNARDLPTDVVELIHGCLVKDPANRPSATELVDALEGMIASWAREQHSPEEGPFRGLQPFTERHADLFFGRDAEIEAIVERLRQETVLPLVGPSGAGKSSLIQAGVIPRLREQGPWLMLQLRPGTQPFRTLAHRLLAGETQDRRISLPGPIKSLRGRERERGSPTPPGGTVPFGEVEQLATMLKRSPELLSLKLRELAERSCSSVLLFVDQLEELHTLVADRDERQRLMGALCTAVDDPLSPVRIVFTLRDDFIVRLALGQAARETLGRVNVMRRPENEALVEILTKPLELLGYRYDDVDLPKEMVAEVGGEPACLPLLQFTGRMLWDRRDPGKRLLRRAAYQEIGGVAGALARHADGVLESLPGPQQRTAREILLRLVSVERTRLVLSKEQILDGLNQRADQVLDRLVEGRLVTVRRGFWEEGEEGALELVHESLIHTWQRLARWIDESREDMAFLEEVSRDADRWHRRGRRDADLWHGERLHEAIRSKGRCAAPIPELIGLFLDSGAQRERRSRRRRLTLYSAVVVALAVTAAVFLILMQRAEQQRQLAEQQRAEARRRWAEAQREGARAAFIHGDYLQSRAKVRGSLEAEDSPLVRALWWKLSRNPQIWRRTLGDAIFDVAASPNGRTLAAACQDKSIYLLDLQTHKIQVLRGHADQVYAVAFSPDGLHLASGSWSGRLRLWNLERGTSTEISGHTGGVRGLTFSPDGRTLASGSYDRTVRLWHGTTGAPIRVLRGHTTHVFGVAFSPDGKALASAANDRTIRIWDPSWGKVLRVLRGHLTGAYALAFSPNSRLLASSGFDNTIRLWDVTSGALRRTLGSTPTAYRLAFSPDGKSLASTGKDRNVVLWEVATGTRLRTLRGHTLTGFGLAFLPDGSRLVSAGRDHTIRLWDLSVASPPAPSGHGDGVYSVAFSPDGKTLASAGRDGTVRLWSREGRQLEILEGHTRPVMTVAFSPDGKTLASGSRDTSVRLWQLQGAGVDVLQGHTATVGRVAFSPDGKTLASASSDSTVQIWDVASRRPLRALTDHLKDVYNVAFSPNGRLLASAGVDQTVRIWRVATGRPGKVLSHPAPVRGVEFSPDGRNVVSSDLSGTLRAWDLRSGQQRELGRQPGRTYYLDVHPDGTRVGVPHADGSARIWQLDTGSHLELRGHAAEVNTLAFSPDGELAATCSDDGTVRLWEARTGRPRWRAPVLLTPSEPRRSSPTLLTHQGWLDLVRGSRAKPTQPRAWRLALEQRAHLAAVSRDGAELCIYTHSGALEIWDRSTDKKLLVRPVARVRRLLALGGGRCVFLGGDRVGLYDRSGRYRLLRKDASAVEEDNGQILVAARGRVAALDPSGGEISSFRSGPGVSAMARTRSWLMVGFENGNIELIQLGDGRPPGFTFEQAPSSPVVRLVPGPMNTLIAGFANGLLGIWHLRDGSQLIQERLHGQVVHLDLDGDRLVAATELGDHLVLDLGIFREGYCALLRSIWSKVPLIWEGGLPVRRAPPGDHVCKSTQPS